MNIHTLRRFGAGFLYFLLTSIHEGFCTLRRDMIGEGLMTRDHQVYRRSDEAAR